MPLANLNPDEVLAACAAGAEEAGGALSRALDGTLTFAPGEAAEAGDAKLAEAGLLVVMRIGAEAAVLAIPESSQLLPAWYGSPDATGTSKLTTLAQELGMLLLPENYLAEDFAAFRVTDIAAALVRGDFSETGNAVSLELASPAHQAAIWLVWPVAKPAELAEPNVAASSPPATAAAPAPRPPAVPRDEFDEALPTLPPYTRSILKIRVPIVVTLASSKQTLKRIVELAPGSIISFDKSCDDTLNLEVNNREVATGEVVKVGDKFGLRITSMIMPPERFVRLQGKRAAAD